MPSTPDPLIETLTRALESHNFADADTCACGVEYDGQTTYERHQAEVYLAAITATGRLLPMGAVVIATTEAAGGFEERTEHGFRYRASGKDWTRIVPARTAKDAAGDARAVLAAGAAEAQALRRSVYIGPWEPLATPDTTGTEEGA